MLYWVPSPIKGGLVVFGMAINTVFMVSILLLVSLLKGLMPSRQGKDLLTRVIIAIAETWMGVNNLLQRLTQDTEWDLQGMNDLDYKGWYFVTSNHQGWTDILVLQRIFNRRIPILKFFLKQQLIWVPFLGLAWWALDFPFMKRFSREYLRQHPEMAGKDLEATQKACEKFKRVPVSVMNFMEGTRFTPEKHALQKSPFRYLLKPKAGGTSFVLSAMGGQIRSMLNVTIFYPEGRTSFWDFVSGKIHRVVVRVDEICLPAELLLGDYENDPEFRARFQIWVNALWEEKDRLLEQVRLQYASSRVS